MANSTTVQILEDGPRNTVIKFEGVLDTSDLASTVILDPATLADIDVNGQKATALRIDQITYSVEDTLSVNLFWDATTPIRIEYLTGRGKIGKAHKFGGIVPTAAQRASAGFNGKVKASTQGWAAGAVLSFSVIIEFVKVV